MAERRMFHAGVVESDAFLDLPLSTQALYFHLGMNADDDGFINGPKQIARSAGCTPADLTALVNAQFLLDFDGVVVLRHWRMANNLRNDRKKELQYPDIAKKIYLLQNKIYTLKRQTGTKSLFTIRKNLLLARTFEDIPCLTDDSPLSDICPPKGKEKNGKEKNRKENKRKEMNAEQQNALDSDFPESSDAAAAADRDSMLSYMHGTLGKGVVLLSEEQIADLLNKIGLDSFDFYVDKLSNYIVKHDAKVKNHYATILKWYEEDRKVTYGDQTFTVKPL